MKSDGERGFTLIEVLVAFVIASVCMVMVFQSFSASLDSGRRAEAGMNALRFAQSKIATLGLEVPVSAGVLVGVPEDGFEWTVEVRPLPPDPNLSAIADLPQLVHVAIRVTAGESDASPVATLETVRPAVIP